MILSGASVFRYLAGGMAVDARTAAIADIQKVDIFATFG